MTLHKAARILTRSIKTSAVHRGTEFEENSMRILENGLSMSLRRIGGRADGGVDLQGWWWLPTEEGSLNDFPDGYRRLRVVVQCKREKIGLGPKYVREMEGVLYRYAAAQPSTEDKNAPPVIGVLVSASSFNTSATLHALSSPLPLVLLRLDIREGNSPPALQQPPNDASGTTGVSFASIVFNAALGGSSGLLRGHCEARWEHAADKTGEGRLGLWWKGEKMKTWTPPVEEDTT